MRRLLHKTGLVPYGDPRAVEIGFPKTDPLLNGSLSREAILRQYGFTGDRPVVVYAPAGTKGDSMNAMGKQLIKRLRDTHRYDLLVKPHDHAHGSVDWFERLAPLEDEHIRLVRDPDVVPGLYAADLLISDASSVSNEYALLDRPMVFLDVPDLIQMELERGTRVDLKTWGRKAGPLAGDPGAAVVAAADELANPTRFSSVRRRLAHDMFYNQGAATAAALRWLDHVRNSLGRTHG